MPVYEVTVSRFATVTDTVLVQAGDETEAKEVATNAADDWDYDTYSTEVEAVSELTSDQVLANATEVVHNG